ncbi:MAG: hypothetical protein IJ455_09145 [Agathobacter sp.]|nr:hypothetical protein [Agathobacter sp.]
MPQKETSNMVNKNFVTEDSTLDDNYLYSASANDMTGLAPTVAHNEYEAQSYEEVFPYLPPVQPNPDGGEVPSVAEGIHAEYRTSVTKQNPSAKKK